MISPAYNRDDVRILVADIGYNEAAKRLNIKPGTIRQWARRGKWNRPTLTHPQAVTPVTKPADAHSNALRELEGRTRMSLAKSARRLAKDAEKATLRDSGHVKEVAQTAAIVHNWGADKGNTQILNVALLTGQEVPEKVIDIESASGQSDVSSH